MLWESEAPDMDSSHFRFNVGAPDCPAVTDGSVSVGPPKYPPKPAVFFAEAAGDLGPGAGDCLGHAFQFPFPGLGRVRAHDSGRRWVASPDVDVE